MHSTTSSTDMHDALRQSLSGLVILPEDPDYDQVRQVWNRRYDRRPRLIVRPRGTADIVEAVRFAKQQDLPVSVRSGGHHIGGVGACDDGLMIDLSLMRSVTVDPLAKTAVVQGGATARDVIRETQLFGLALPTGNLGAVGVAALALGGGLGYMRRQYGLTLDHLEALDLVLADGSVAHVDDYHQPDLFWAIRGGGGNFGVAATLYFRLVSVGPMVAGIQVVYSAEDLPEVVRGCRDFLSAVGTAVSINIDLMAMPAIPAVPAPLSGKTVISVTGMHASQNLDEALKAIDAIRRLATPLADFSGPMSYTDVHTRLDRMLPADHRGHIESQYLNTFSDALIEDVDDIMKRAVPGRTMRLWPLGGAMAQRAADDTAFGDRNAPLVVMLEVAWQQHEKADEAISWVRSARSRLARYAYNGGTYLNLVDTSDEPDLVPNTFGENYARLRELKRRYDPHNMFRFNANIQP